MQLTTDIMPQEWNFGHFNLYHMEVNRRPKPNLNFLTKKSRRIFYLGVDFHMVRPSVVHYIIQSCCAKTAVTLLLLNTTCKVYYSWLTNGIDINIQQSLEKTPTFSQSRDLRHIAMRLRTKKHECTNLQDGLQTIPQFFSLSTCTIWCRDVTQKRTMTLPIFNRTCEKYHSSLTVDGDEIRINKEKILFTVSITIWKPALRKIKFESFVKKFPVELRLGLTSIW